MSYLSGFGHDIMLGGAVRGVFIFIFIIYNHFIRPQENLWWSLPSLYLEVGGPSSSLPEAPTPLRSQAAAAPTTALRPCRPGLLEAVCRPTFFVGQGSLSLRFIEDT